MTDNLYAVHNYLSQYLVIENIDRIKYVSRIFCEPFSTSDVFNRFIQFILINQPSKNEELIMIKNSKMRAVQFLTFLLQNRLMSKRAAPSCPCSSNIHAAICMEGQYSILLNINFINFCQFVICLTGNAGGAGQALQDVLSEPGRNLNTDAMLFTDNIRCIRKKRIIILLRIDICQHSACPFFIKLCSLTDGELPLHKGLSFLIK